MKTIFLVDDSATMLMRLDGILTKAVSKQGNDHDHSYV